MTELEKLKAGLEYNFYDEEVAGVKGNALKKCQILKALKGVYVLMDVKK